MQNLLHFSPQKKITFLTVLFSFIFILLLGTNEFKNNYLNYSTFLMFGGALLFLKGFIFTAIESESNLLNRNWFSFGVDIILSYTQIWLIIQAVRYMNQSSDPFNTVWFFLMSSIAFFGQVYITKSTKLFIFSIAEIVLFAVLAFVLKIINIYTPDNQTYLLIQVSVGYSVFFSALITYFLLLQNTLNKDQAKLDIKLN